MSNTKKYLEIVKTLRERGERITTLRKNIIEIFIKNKAPLSVKDLSLKLKKYQLSFNKTTVYRQIDDLITHGILDEVRLADRTVRYELKDREHHHHLICLTCDKIQEVNLQKDLAGEEKTIEKNSGFKILKHNLEFFGKCKQCSN